MERKKFDAEVGKILHLMIHSLYSNKEIFMRELISNSSDACDKLRYISQVDSKIITDDNDFKIIVKIDKEKNTISIKDNGIGMNKEDLIENLGTIARSGTQNFVQQLSGNDKKDSMLIGQFGVGFYSTFMVAENITVISKKAGETKAYSWSSDGIGEYMISETDFDAIRGTEVIVSIKENEKAYLDYFRLQHIIKNYSDHIAIPIYLVDEEDKENQINSSSALWRRSKSDITQEQYKEFYKNVSYAADDPWIIMHNKNEGKVEFTNLLFIPTTKTFDLFHPDRKRRVKLYIKRVFITDDNIDIVPSYMRFLRGVVDSEDLPLNISRETLQHNTTIEKIKASITKRVLSELEKKSNDSYEEYSTFWNNFGAVLKEGLCEQLSDHEQLLKVCIFRSALHAKMITLDEYISNMQDDQKVIYFLSGDDPEKLKSSPQIEGFISKGIDVLLFTDTVDDFWVSVNNRYKDCEIKSVTRSDIDLDHDQNKSQDANEKDGKTDTNAEYEKLIGYFKNILGDLVKDVILSKKLTSSPACLTVSSGGMDIRMERFLIEQKQLNASSAKMLELNPKHHLIKKINTNLKDDNKIDNSAFVHLIYDQACIIEGEPVNDIGGFVKRMNDLFNIL